MNHVSDKQLKKYIGRHWYYYNEIIKNLRFLIPKNSSVLDVRCGTGNILASLEPKRGVGLDPGNHSIRLAKERFKHLEFHSTSIENFESDEKFDYIILVNAVGYFDDIQSSLENLRKFCHRDTRLIIFHYSFLWHPILKLAEITHLKMKEKIQNWVSPSDVVNFLNICGYDTIQHGRKILLPVWIPLLSKFTNKYLGNLPVFNLFDLMHFYVARIPEPLPIEKTSCSVIIPARNEEGNIEAAVQRLPKLGPSTEIIFVEGHSKDNTWKEIVRVAKKYGNEKNIKICQQDGKGKGDAVRKGFSMASNNILFILDADLTVAPEELGKFHELIASGKGEFINGSRLVYPMEEKAMRPLNLIANKSFSLIFTFLLNQRFKDTLCGTKVLTKANYEKIAANRSYFGDFDPFGDFDLIFGASRLSLKIIEMPIHYKQRTYGETNISRWKHGWLLLKMCVFASRKIKFL